MLPLSKPARAFALALLMLACIPRADAQCGNANSQADILPRIPAPKKPPAEPILPEAGFLANTHYTSQFFGFSLDLPLTVEGHQVMMPLMPEKRHALLALQYERGHDRGYIMVTAEDPAPGHDINIPEERQQELQSWGRTAMQSGRLPQGEVPQFMLRRGHFYRSITHHGRLYAAHYWAGMNNYTVNVFVATTDTDFLRKAKDAMDDVKIYCPQDDGSLLTEDGKPVKAEGEPYAGPTVPTARVNAALHDAPGNGIPLGEAAGRDYRNPELGFNYELPAGWKPLVTGKGDLPLDATAAREYRFLHACSQTLLQAVPQQHKDGDAIHAAIVLRALDPNCLAMRTAASLTDKRTTDEVAASLEQLGEFGSVVSDQLLSLDGHLFMAFYGTIGTSPRGDALAVRLSQTMFATRYNKLLLVWTFMAENASALDELPTGAVTFGDAKAIELRRPGTQRASQ